MQDCVDQQVQRYYPKWKDHCLGLTRGDKVRADDLLHEVLTQILERDTEKMKAITCTDGFYYYVCRAIWLAWCGDINSGDKYIRKYRQFDSKRVDAEFDDNRQDTTFIGARLDNEYIDGYLMRMNEHDAILLRLWAMPDFSYDKLAGETGLDKHYLTVSVYRALKRLRDSIHKHNADQL